MKIRIETTDGDDEIVIKCRHPDGRTAQLSAIIEGIIRQNSEQLLFIGNTEYYIDRSEILFFETSDGKVYAHTADRMLRCEHKLFELEEIMPPYFVRISKSAIANVLLISSMSRELIGNGSITFKGSDKVAYFSRSYYKKLKEKIEEMRFDK